MSEVIFTHHAQKRLEERYFRKDLVIQTIIHPDAVAAGKHKGTLEYVKQFTEKKVTAIVTKTTKGEHLVLSCWIDPPHYGTLDHHKQTRYKAYRTASFWGRIWMDLKSIFGL